MRGTCCSPTGGDTVHATAARTIPPVTSTATRQGRRWPWVVIGIYVVLQGIVLRAETWPAAPVRINDYAVHIALVRWAADRIAAGHLPLDGWFPNLGLGTPYFHQYQTLPHLVGALFAQIVDAGTVVRWSGYLLLTLWPLFVFLGVRMLTKDDVVAVAAGVVAPLIASAPGFGYEYRSYGFVGYGLWPNLIAMTLTPFALALTWRAIERGRAYAVTALVVAVTIMCHFMTGYLMMMWIAIVAIVGPGPIGTRLKRGGLVAGSSLIVAAPLLVPVIVDGRWIARSQGTPAFIRDSFGARQVLEWLFTGRLFDEGHTWFPIVSVLVAVGSVVCVRRFRADALSRALVCFFVASLVLYFGRPTLGPLIDLIPSGGDLFLHRFLAGVHLGGIVLAGVGAGAIVRAAWDHRDRVSQLTPVLAAALLGAVCALAVLPAWRESAKTIGNARTLIARQQTADAHQGADLRAVVARAKELGGGRLYAGNPRGSGSAFLVGDAAVYEEFLNFDAPALGFWGRSSSLSTDAELQFDASRPEQAALFGVHYLVLPRGVRPPNGTRVMQRGDFALWRVGPGGYFGVYDVVGPAISADRTNLGSRVEHYLRSQLPARHATQPIAFDGDSPAAPTIAHAAATDDRPGTVRFEQNRPNDGVYAGTVTTKRKASVVLSQSYHPRWHVTVDGKERPTEMVAPSFVAVTVGPGTHRVVFTYEPYPATSYALLALLSVAMLIALAVVPRVLRARRFTQA
jgi:hypothetical protein